MPKDVNAGTIQFVDLPLHKIPGVFGLVFNGVDGVMEGLELEPLISHMISSMADGME